MDIIPLKISTISLFNKHVNKETGLFDLQSFNHAIIELEAQKLVNVDQRVMPDACGKWQNTKPEKPCYFIHRYTKKDNKPDLYDAYIDGGILSVANIQDDEFICTMGEFADGEFYIVEYH